MTRKEPSGVNVTNDYDGIKQRFAQERDLRVDYRPEGRAQYTSDLSGELACYEVDPHAEIATSRDAIEDTVEILFIGGGFSALLTAARLRQAGFESIRIVERGSDVGGTWYWNRYPGVACDVVAYDYLPLLDEMEYVPTRHYAEGWEILAHCQAIARRYDLYDLAVFQTTVTSTTWDSETAEWIVTTDRGDAMRARFVVCANGPLSKPKLARIKGMETFAGHSFHTSRWDYAYTGANLEFLADKVVGIIGTGASAVQVVPKVANAAKELYVFQRTPSSIDIKDDWATDPEWAAKLAPGWQAKRRAKAMTGPRLTELPIEQRAGMTHDERIQAQEQANIDHMMRIHRRIDEVVVDPATAESLKPWYMYMCKRPCFHNEYLPSFNRPNVHLVDTRGKGITEIGQDGPVFEGTTYELDLLVYATGFEVQQTGTYNEIVGANGTSLSEKYVDGIRTLFGVHTAGYPNMFIMGGYQASYSFNLTDELNAQGDHIAECISYMRDNGHATIDANADSEQWWVDEVIAHRGKTSRNADCTPGYYNFEGETNPRQNGNYNGGFPAYYRFMTSVRAQMPEHFTFA